MLFLAVPFALASQKFPPVICFIICFIAIIPLAKILGTATEELSLYTNQTLGGLLTATFGNAIEIIIGIIAVKDNLLRVVQANMLGSILSNLLLVLGTAFVAAGLRFNSSTFNSTAAQTASGMLLLAVMGLTIPATMVLTGGAAAGPEDQQVLSMSRFTAIVLILVYACYLAFQLKTHAALYDDEEHADGPQPPVLPLWGAVALLLATAVLVSVIAEFLVGSIDEARC